ncbi:N-acetyltransferase [Actinorhabdospora filicis]|uniref:N-acetyltransferase n=1 Tax=Actinorhabdospora filicis TaxID=1785913 RepID=A0A9W6WC54_9ACTN|nr:GNAT family N-acetyltransferase [Actinorhabdospora filicis]GLZ80256.1 N-acetyltransferase [Actinorhabdospora filicis]
MPLIAHADTRPIEPASVLALYAEEGWWPERTGEQVGRLLAAGPSVGAWDGDRLVGFARAVTDGVCRAYIEDVIVTGPMRGSSLGRRLMEALRERLDATLAPGAVVSLFCGPDLVPFYEWNGFAFTSQRVGHHSR